MLQGNAPIQAGLHHLGQSIGDVIQITTLTGLDT